MKVPVLIPRIFDHPHTYLTGKIANLKPGSLVTVPFGKDEEIPPRDALKLSLIKLYWLYNIVLTKK